MVWKSFRIRPASSIAADQTLGPGPVPSAGALAASAEPEPWRATARAEATVLRLRLKVTPASDDDEPKTPIAWARLSPHNHADDRLRGRSLAPPLLRRTRLHPNRATGRFRTPAPGD